MSGQKFVDELAALEESPEAAPNENEADDLENPDTYDTTDVATEPGESPELDSSVETNSGADNSLTYDR